MGEGLVCDDQESKVADGGGRNGAKDEEGKKTYSGAHVRVLVGLHLECEFSRYEVVVYCDGVTW